MTDSIDGSAEVVMPVHSFPFCIDWLPDGRLLIVHARDGVHWFKTIVAAITRGGAEHLGLAPGDEVTVLIKATEVMIGK